MTGTEQRFWKYVEKTEDCWNWTGTATRTGYGQFRDGRRVYAHRWSYERYAGAIPDGLQLDHLCRNRGCVNPSHLEPVTHAENHRRRIGYKTGPYDVGTHCRHGHERTPENTQVNANGARICLPCARHASQRYRARRPSTTTQ